jgi:large subunit ribosomal protein L18
MFKKINKNEVRMAKHTRIRYTLSGTADMPRLNVYRSINEISAQLIDDKAGRTLCSASSQEKALKEALAGKTKVEKALEVGKLLGERAKKVGVKKVVFDRSGYAYTGRVKSLADGARSAGLEF